MNPGFRFALIPLCLILLASCAGLFTPSSQPAPTAAAPAETPQTGVETAPTQTNTAADESVPLNPKAAGTMEYISGIVQIPHLGVYCPAGASADQGFLVNEVPPGSAAEGRLQQMDIVKAIDSEFIDSWESYYSILLRYFPSQYVRVWFIRNEEKMQVDLPLGAQEVPSDYEALLRVLAAGEPVRLAVVISTMERLGDYSDEENELWRAGAEQMLLATTEAAWQRNFQQFNGFSIVDRFTLDAIINEHQLALSGMVEDSVELGRLAGATHILEKQVTTHPDPTAEAGEYTNYSNRLVDVETGIVAASMVYRTY